MNRPLMLAAVALMSCAHAKQTKEQETAKTEADTPKEEKKAEEKAKAPPRTETLATSKTTKQMFKPEGLKKLQTALASKDAKEDENGQLDSQTQEALRAYQKKQGLPATGLPDYETLRRLGLKPDEVFHREPPGERVGVQ